MYKVFFADDEASMRAGIRRGINWDKSGFTLAGEAPDGEMALSMMREIMPDILITDVKMPFMDGIELARQCKKTMPWIKIIILSGHDEFDYAKQAITIGVSEYLLKPVTSEILLAALNKLAETIELERKSDEKLERLMNASRQKQTERLLAKLMYGEDAPQSAEAEAAVAEARELGIELSADLYIILQIELETASNCGYEVLEGAFARAVGVLSGWENAIFFSQGAERITCVLKGFGSDASAALEEEAYTLAQAVKYEAERGSGCLLSVAVGSVANDISGWRGSLSDANTARRYLGLANRSQIMSLSDIRRSGLLPFTEIKKLPTPEKLRYASKNDIPRVLEDCFGEFSSMQATSFIFLNYIYVDILMAVSKIIEESGGAASDVLADFIDMSRVMGAGHNGDVANHVKDALTEMLERAIDYRDSVSGSKYGDVIAKAHDYIRSNFHKQEISLYSAATEVNMSPNHFSTVFSQETGETFIGYVTKIRLEEAKRLLKTTNMRTSDVAYAVGYSDTHYFSYVFKKNTGITPKEFRK